VFEPAPHLEDPWIVLQGQQDQVCDPKVVDAFAAATANSQVVKLPAVGHGFSVERNWLPQFRAAHQRLARRAKADVASSAQLNDLPLIEVPARGKGAALNASPPLVILLSGDGGWAGIDRELSAQLAQNGVPVVGFNTLRYFWEARTPEETARDVARTMQHYMHAWSCDRVLLLGYSLGADVLPFVLNRLPEEARQAVSATVLIGLSDTAIFEIHVSEWLHGAASRGLPVEPELRSLDRSHVLCLYGAGEGDSLCPALARDGASAEQIGSGHHLGGRYDEIARRILEFSAAAERRKETPGVD
jgi:type IV secretory pathway VirJ component